MRVYIVVTTSHKAFFLIYLNNNKSLKHGTYFIIKHNELLVGHKIKKRDCPNKSTEMILMNTRNSKTSKPQKCVLNLSHRLDLINFCSSRLVYLLQLQKYIRQQYKNNKLNIIVPM